MFRVPKDTVMTPELLEKYIGEHKVIVNERLQRLQDAYENRYDIHKQEKKPKYKPDNRISVNFAKYIVDTFNGFFIGIPVKVIVDSEADNNENIVNFMKELDGLNSLDNKNREIAKKCDIHGSCNEIYFTDENGDIGIMQVSMMESFFIYDESIRQRPLFFVRYYQDSNGVERGTYSDDSIVQKFINDGSCKFIEDPEEHHFDGVPATEYISNTERRGLFESELDAMNEYNKALSEKANDVDYFADAYLKILGPELSEKDIREIRQDRIFNYSGDNNSFPVVDFLQKPSNDDTQEHLLERLKDDIFQVAMVINTNDETFGNASGVSLKHKLNNMSNLAKVKTGLFKESFARRYKIIFSNPIVQTKGINADDWKKLDYKFHENYPANIEEEADIVSKLSGEISERTKLSMLSTITDVDEEIEAMKKEQNENQKDIVSRLMFTDEGDVNEG